MKDQLPEDEEELMQYLSPQDIRELKCVEEYGKHANRMQKGKNIKRLKRNSKEMDDLV